MRNSASGRVALLVRVTGEPSRLDANALETFADMARVAEDLSGYAGARLLLVDRDHGTIVGLFIAESRESAERQRGRTETAVEVASVIIGGSPSTATIEIFDVVDAEVSGLT